MKLVTIFNVPPKSSLTNNVLKDSVDKVFFLFFNLFLRNLCRRVMAIQVKDTEQFFIDWYVSPASRSIF